MSVINTMLKDLERRGVDPSSSNDNVLGGLSANSSYVLSDDDRPNPYIIGAIITFILFSIFAVVYIFSPYKLVMDEKSSVSQQVNLQKQQQQPIALPATTNVDTVGETPSASNGVEKAVMTQVAPAKNTNLTPIVTQPINKPVQAETVAVVAKKVVQQKQPVFVRQQPVIRKEKATIAKSAPTKKSITSEVEYTEERSGSESETINKKQLPVTPQEQSMQLYGSAQVLYNRGSKRRSKALLQEALGLSVDNVQAYRLLTIIYLEEGRSDLATEIMEQGLAENGNDQQLLRLYLQTLVQEGKYKAAISIMEKRIRITTPDDIGYLAGLYQKDNNHQKAIIYYSRALQLKPNKSIWWMGQGISFEILKQYQPSLKSYQQAINTGQLSSTLADYVFNKIKAIKQFAAESAS